MREAILHDTRRFQLVKTLLRCIISTLVLVGIAQSAIAADPPYLAGETVGDLKNTDIVESSGVAVSRRHPERFWTHNDSGGEAILYAFNEQGQDLGTCRLNHVTPIDWEDMGSFSTNQADYLFVADVGDNARRRQEYRIDLIREPDQLPVDVDAKSITFRYPDGSHDCEAVGFDPQRREFILVEKRLAFSCRVYRLKFPEGAHPATTLADQVADVPIPLATGLDISADGLRLIVVTYGPAYLYERTAQEDWAAALARKPSLIPIPGRAQGESICFGADGRTIFATSEKSPTPVIRMRPHP